MDIYLTICRKTIPACSYCLEAIEISEPMVCGRLWQKRTEEGGEPRRWVKNFRWHAQRKKDNQCCWLSQALENLSQHPVLETRGRKGITLPKLVKEERLKILRQRARAVAKLKELMLAPLRKRDVDEIIKIGSRIEEMKERISQLGGVPKSWE